MLQYGPRGPDPLYRTGLSLYSSSLSQGRQSHTLYDTLARGRTPRTPRHALITPLLVAPHVRKASRAMCGRSPLSKTPRDHAEHPGSAEIRAASVPCNSSRRSNELSPDSRLTFTQRHPVLCGCVRRDEQVTSGRSKSLHSTTPRCRRPSSAVHPDESPKAHQMCAFPYLPTTACREREAQCASDDYDARHQKR